MMNSTSTDSQRDSKDAVPSDRDQTDRPPIRWRDCLFLLLLVVLADVTLYHGHGSAGLAAFLIGSALLLIPIRDDSRDSPRLLLFGIMIAMLSAKLVWCGDAFQAIVGLILLSLHAMSLSGITPGVGHLFYFLVQLIPGGTSILASSSSPLAIKRPSATRSRLAAILFPVAALLAFGLLFVFANPDLYETVQARWIDLTIWLSESVADWIPEPLQIVFWIVMLILFAGAARPLKLDFVEVRANSPSPDQERQGVPHTLYNAWLNMLSAVIVLFAAYLVYEFQSLWFRTFPEGFHYSGYAHEGAFWLTVALMLATVVLSSIFRGELLSDARIGKLKTLAWIWSAQNVLLAIAVYHRLSIYVEFNGMTRLRVVGYLGITAVLAGFVLVVAKIAREREFRWLVNRQVAVVSFAIYLFAIAPVDQFVMQLNAQRILAGDPAPAVQISVQPIDSTGMTQLVPLIDSEDPLIRAGVRSLLWTRRNELRQRVARQSQHGWTAWQGADRDLLEILNSSESRLAPFDDNELRENAWSSFEEYVYRWY